MAFGIYAKIYKNSNNPDKVQQGPARGIDAYRESKKFRHPKDAEAARQPYQSSPQQHARDMAKSNVPHNRAYQVIGETDVSPVTGFDHNRVTLRSNPAIAWDSHSQKWVPATYAEPARPLDRLAKLVKAPAPGKNRHRGGSW